MRFGRSLALLNCNVEKDNKDIFILNLVNCPLIEKYV